MAAPMSSTTEPRDLGTDTHFVGPPANGPLVQIPGTGAGITRLSAQPSASGDLGKPGALAASPAASASFFHSAVRSPLHGFPCCLEGQLCHLP